MPTKNITLSFIRQISLFLLIFFLLIRNECSLSFSLKDIKKVCSNSDEYITDYFSEDDELPEEYNKLDEKEIKKGDNEKIIKLILLSKNAETEYENSKASKLMLYKIILLILIILFSIIIIAFEIHFLCRISCGGIIKKNLKIDEVTCFTYIKINPICFFKYLKTDQKERVKYFTE